MATFESPIYSLRAQDISFKLAIKSSFCFGLWSKQPFMSDIFLLEVDNWFDENTHSNYYDTMWLTIFSLKNCKLLVIIDIDEKDVKYERAGYSPTEPIIPHSVAIDDSWWLSWPPSLSVVARWSRYSSQYILTTHFNFSKVVKIFRRNLCISIFWPLSISFGFTAGKVVKILQRHFRISTTCRNSWSYSKRCFGYYSTHKTGYKDTMCNRF